METGNFYEDSTGENGSPTEPEPYRPPTGPGVDGGVESPSPTPPEINEAEPTATPENGDGATLVAAQEAASQVQELAALVEGFLTNSNTLTYELTTHLSSGEPDTGPTNLVRMALVQLPDPEGKLPPTRLAIAACANQRLNLDTLDVGRIKRGVLEHLDFSSPKGSDTVLFRRHAYIPIRTDDVGGEPWIDALGYGGILDPGLAPTTAAFRLAAAERVASFIQDLNDPNTVPDDSALARLESALPEPGNWSYTYRRVDPRAEDPKVRQAALEEMRRSAPGFTALLAKMRRSGGRAAANYVLGRRASEGK